MSAFTLPVRQFGGVWRKAGGESAVLGYRPLEGGRLGFYTPRLVEGTVVLDEWREYRLARFVFLTTGVHADCGQRFGVMTARHRPLLFTADEVASKPEWTAREALPGELSYGIAYHTLKQGAA